MKIDPSLYHRSYAARRVADRVMQRAGQRPEDVRSIECVDGIWHIEVYPRGQDGRRILQMGSSGFEVVTRTVRTTL